MRKKIMLVDDEEKIRNILSKLLTKEGYETLAVANGRQALEFYPQFKPDLVILDYQMPGMTGLDLMKEMKKQRPDQRILLITAFGNIALAVEAMKLGANDFIEKPFDNNDFLCIVNKSVVIKPNEEKITPQKAIEEKIIGKSQGLKQVLAQAQKVANTNATVLLTGESGVGKDVIARYIHENSINRKGGFIALNCGAIPLHLIESELFGYEKGAFTDAKESKQGLFEMANEGTLFLDEIGELSLDAQVKLLRVLEEKRVLKLGGQKYIDINVRIVSATNKNLENKVSEGSFRLDLLYRLNLFTIKIPPLKERKEDIPELVNYFIEKHNSTLSLNIQGISDEALVEILGHTWPGNIRDLENAIQSSMIMCSSGIISPEHLPLRLNEENNVTRIHSSENLTLGKRDFGPELEIQLINDALIKCKHNKTATAELLNISRKTLFNKMRKYNLW